VGRGRGRKTPGGSRDAGRGRWRRQRRSVRHRACRAGRGAPLVQRGELHDAFSFKCASSSVTAKLRGAGCYPTQAAAAAGRW
jgi:hypothetical protein